MARVALIVLVGTVLLAPGSTLAQIVTVSRDSPPEVLLPFIDTGEREIDRRLVALYAGLLDQLAARCRQDRRMISDQSVRATQMIERDRGLEVSNARFLRAWLDAVRGLPADPALDCTPIAATLAVTIGGLI